MTGEVSTSYVTKRRILQVSTLEMTGGAARIAWNLHRAYSKRGLQSWMAVGQKESDDPNVFQIPNEYVQRVWTRILLGISRRLRSLGAWRPSEILRWIAEPMRLWDVFRGIEDFHYPGSWRVLELPSERPDVVHCHNLHGGYFDLRVLPWLSYRVPVALTLHDTWLLSGHCAYSLDCERWLAGCGQCPDLTIYPALRRDATAYNWHRKRDIYARSKLRIATPSRWLMNRVERSILAPAMVEGRVIHNGVDLSVFQPGDKQAARAGLGLAHDATILLFVRQGPRSNPFKDYATIEGALRQVAAQDEEHKLLLLCLGEERPEERLGMARVRFAGYQKDLMKVAQFYQAADLYLHAAHVDADTFPNTVLEALACGIPVVATAVGGIPEQVEDGVSGFLVPPGDSEAMATRVEQLLDDNELRQRFADKAVESARQRFDLNRQVEDYLGWYDEILDAYRSERGADV